MKVSQWAEIRRLFEVERLSMRAIARRVGCARKTVHRALGLEEAPSSKRKVASRFEKLDPFKPRIKAIIQQYPELSAVRVDGEVAVEGDACASLDERPRLPLAAESERFEPHHRQEAEPVVELDQVDVSLWKLDFGIAQGHALPSTAPSLGAAFLPSVVDQYSANDS